LILIPEYVLIREEDARRILPLAEEIPVNFVVISEATSLSSTAIRSWTALGASDVWLNESWQEKLLAARIQRCSFSVPVLVGSGSEWRVKELISLPGA
jgi:hypothetical protein